MLRLVTTILALVVLATTARGDVLHVDDDNCPGPGSGSIGDPFCLIQDAIDAAVSGDEIIVHPGTYAERIAIFGKAIALLSSDGPEVTSIDGNGVGPVVRCENIYTPGAVVEGFTITGGLAPLGGGMYISNASPDVVDCIFRENQAWMGVEARGGGMFVYGGSPLVSGCTFIGNAVGGPDSKNAYGGGLYLEQSDAAVLNCRFLGNSATADFPEGTVNASGAGVCVLYGIASVINCEFSGNSASATTGDSVDDVAQAIGSGIVNAGAGVTVSNCTFSGNTATVTPSDGLALGAGVTSLATGTTTVANSIFFSNSAQPPYADIFGTVTVTFSCAFPFPLDGAGNIDDDPLLVDADGSDNVFGTADDDVHLQAGSPCINTGSNDAPELPDTDLDGHARILCDQVDMGAYEFGIGDYECDFDVDLADFAAWEACMTGPDNGPYIDYCEAFDFESDGDVDMCDFASFQAIFEGQP